MFCIEPMAAEALIYLYKDVYNVISAREAEEMRRNQVDCEPEFNDATREQMEATQQRDNTARKERLDRLLVSITEVMKYFDVPLPEYDHGWVDETMERSLYEFWKWA